MVSINLATEELVGHSGGSITAHQIGRVFTDESGRETVALESIDLDIKPGEFLSLIGSSGCGKSTFLRLVAGLALPTHGELLLDGVPVDGPHFTRGLVFQDPTLFPWLNVWENVASGLVARKTLNQHRDEVDEYIELVGLKGFEKNYPHQLSGGMAQRVALARALINQPKVLLLDEPLAALDAFTRFELQDELLRIWRERGTTFIMVTHDVDEAIYLSGRIVIMTPRPGRIQKIVNVELGHPRSRTNPDFVWLRNHILETLHLARETSLSYYL